MRYLLAWAFATLGCVSPLAAGEVLVSAAASLTDVLKQIGSAHEKESGDHVTFNFAASSMLARQIEEGAPVDLFLSADEAKMDQLQKKDLLVTESRQTLLTNTLALIAPVDSRIDFGHGPGPLGTDAVKKIALADPRAVPAGIYAQEYLTRIGLWSKVEAKIIPAENVRAALAVVETGNADAGFVYQTDAKISQRVKVAFAVPQQEGPKITYPVAVLREAKNRAGAEKFLAFLRSAPAMKYFQDAGFGIAP